MATKYQKFGLRADKNLSDLPNKDLALANVLNGLSQTEVFEPGDIRVINGIRNIDVNSGDLSEVNDIVQEYSPLSGGNNRAVEPLITVKDAIDNFKIVLGNPPYLSGGSGPFANIYPSSLLRNQNLIDETSLGSNVIDVVTQEDAEKVIGPVDFWDNGVFRLDTKLHPDFSDPYGAVQWEGYANFSSIRFETTGLLIVEQDIADDGNWAIYKSIYNDEYEISVSAGSYDAGSDTTTIPLADWTDHRYIAIGQTVQKVSYSGPDDPLVINSFTFDEDAQTASFTVEGELPDNGNTSNVLIENILGADTVLDTGTISLYQSYRGDKIKTRITWWYPNYGQGDLYQTKSLITNPFTASERLPYSFWYKEYDRDYVAPVGSIEHFIDNRASPTKTDSEAPLQINDSVYMDYDPPTSSSDIVKTETSTFYHESFGKLVGGFSNVEEGDWICFRATSNNDTYARQIKEKASDSVVYVDDWDNFVAADENTTYTAKVFSRRGLVGVFEFEWNQSNYAQAAILPINNGSSFGNVLYNDYLIYGVTYDVADTNGAFDNIYRLSGVSYSGSTATATLIDVFGSNLTNQTENTTSQKKFVGVYLNTGLRDLSTVAQCFGTYGKEVATTVNGGTTVQLLDVDGISNGDYAQFVGTNGFINGSPNATTRSGYIDVGVEVTNVNTSTNTITLAATSGGTAPIVGEVPSAATVVFVQGGLSSNDQSYNPADPVDREFCVLPLNTAPPFEGTTTGLRTRTAFPHLRVETLAVSGFDFTLSSAPAEVTTETQYSKYLPITYNGTTYKALIK